MTDPEVKGTVLVVVRGGLVQEIVADVSMPGLDVRVLDFDRDDENRDDTAEFLWNNRDVLRVDGWRTGRHSAVGNSAHDIDIRRERFDVNLY